MTEIVSRHVHAIQVNDPMVETAAMLETAMPTIVLRMVFAEQYGLDTNALAQAILASTFVSMVTLPFLLRML